MKQYPQLSCGVCGQVFGAAHARLPNDLDRLQAHKASEHPWLYDNAGTTYRAGCYRLKDVRKRLNTFLRTLKKTIPE